MGPSGTPQTVLFHQELSVPAKTQLGELQLLAGIQLNWAEFEHFHILGEPQETEGAGEVEGSGRVTLTRVPRNGSFAGILPHGSGIREWVREGIVNGG